MIRASQGENVGTVTDYIPMNLVSADNVADMEDWKQSCCMFLTTIN